MHFSFDLPQNNYLKIHMIKYSQLRLFNRNTENIYMDTPTHSPIRSHTVIYNIKPSSDSVLNAEKGKC